MKTVFHVLLLCCLAGCAVPGQAPETIRRYSLDYDLPAVETVEKNPWVVQVRVFSVSPDYNNTKMIYRDRPGVSQAYEYSRWRANPGEKIAGLLTRDLRKSGLFTAVNGPESLLPSTHTLEGSVEEFYEDSSAKTWLAKVKISLTLVANHEMDLSRQYLFQKDFFAQAEIDEHGPRGLAVAMSRAMADLSRQVRTALSQEQDSM